MGDMPEFDVISNDSGDLGALLSGPGPHSHDELLAAAQKMLDSEWMGDAADDYTAEQVVADSTVKVLRAHVNLPPSEVGCGCEPEGWYCEQGDGPPLAWLWWSV